MASVANKIIAVVLTVAGVYDIIIGLMNLGQGGILIFGLPGNLVIGPILLVIGIVLVKKWILVDTATSKAKS